MTRHRDASMTKQNPDLRKQRTTPNPEVPFLTMGPTSFVQFRDGAKTATVVSGKLARVVRDVGRVRLWLQGGSAEMPCRVEWVEFAKHVGKVPSIAECNGVSLEEFTQAHSTWKPYLQALTRQQHFQGAVAVVALTPDGPVSGSVDARPRRQNADSWHGKPWQSVDPAVTPIGPDTQVHPADRATLDQRVRDLVDTGVTSDKERAAVEATLPALLRDGRCRATLRRQSVSPRKTALAHEVLQRAGAVVPLGESEWVFAPSVLSGLRVLVE